MNFEAELLKLQRDLNGRTYRPGRSVCFVVTKPKPREIFAADFRDRIVHHVLVGYLEPIWERIFISQSYACRKNKGAHQAIKDLKRYISQAGRGAFYLQIDIQSFFVSLKKEILLEMIKRHTKNPEILWLAKTIIFYNPLQNYYYRGQLSLLDLIPGHKSLFRMPTGQGLPIGNLTSQFFANVYLNSLDQFIKHKLKIKHYLRYVDDLAILSRDREQLEIWREKIDEFLREGLKLKLHPKKQILREISRGINFLGFVVKPDYVLTRRRVVKSLKERLWRLNQDFSGLMEEEPKQILSMINSYYGQFKHAKTFGLRQKLWRNNFGKLRDLFEPIDKNFSYFKIS